VEDTGIFSEANDRRKHPRYRFSTPISIDAANEELIQGIMIEISESGFSAAIAAPLKIGDRVKILEIAGGETLAEVRHAVGRLYGFQFIDLGAEQRKKICEDCRRLPRFRSRSLDL